MNAILLEKTAADWLRQQDSSAPLVVVAAHRQAGQELIYRVADELGAVMGWQCRAPLELGSLNHIQEPAVLLFDLQSVNAEEQLQIDALCARASSVFKLDATADALQAAQVVTPDNVAAMILIHAASGARFDEMAIVLSAEATQREPVRLALRRASIPAYFAAGNIAPNPHGMAFLALLRFALNSFSLEGLCEYLSLTRNAELEAIVEQQLAIHGIPVCLEDWRNPEEPRLASVLGPLFAEFSKLDGARSWQDWLKILERLALVAIDRPQSVMGALRAMTVPRQDAFGLEAVFDLLQPHLSLQNVPQPGSRYGQVYVCTETQLRGHQFRIVLSCTTRTLVSLVAEPITSTTDFKLNFLDELFANPDVTSTTGQARFLLSDSPHLARALRQRALRWRKGRWSSADGFTQTSDESHHVLAEHRPEHRAYSPTALQLLASCPYKFFLYAISGLKPRQRPQRVLMLDALQRGSLVHEILFEFLSACRAQALLPLRDDQLVAARELLKYTYERVIAKYQRLWAPISAFVWAQEMHELHADLYEWLDRTAQEKEWQPWLFELAFGLPGRDAQDPRSVNHPVQLEAGLQIRGAIDLVERHVSGALRATDFKTGKARTKNGLMMGGGEVLQPLLYALALEKIFPEQRVAGGRLYYCSSQAGYSDVTVPLTPRTRIEISLLKNAVDECFDRNLFITAPTEGRCQYCDYQVICGEAEEQRVRQLRPGSDFPKLNALRASL